MEEYSDVPEKHSLDSMEGVEYQKPPQLEVADATTNLEKELKVKLLFISSGSSFSRPITYCEDLGRNEDATEIKHCNILFQGGALLDAAKLVIKSIEGGRVDVNFKYKDKRDFYYGEDSLDSVIGHEIGYAIYEEKDYPYAQIEELFTKIREEYDWDAPPEKILEMCKYIVGELEKLTSGRDVVLEYLRVLDKFNVSREEMLKYNIRNRINEKVPRKIQHLLDNPEENNNNTQLERDIIEILKIRDSWLNLPITDFIELMKSLDSLLNEYINLDNQNRVKRVGMITYKLNQLLYREDIDTLVQKD
jgi:hypothetical protein